MPIKEMLRQDALLIAGIKSGDDDAFIAVVERYQVAIGRYLLRLVSDQALAEDLCQETFFRAYRAIFKTDDELALKPWLYRIATNAAYSALRRRRRAPDSLDDLAQHKQPHRASYLERQAIQRDLVQRALAQLSPEHAVPLLLNSVEGFITKSPPSWTSAPRPRANASIAPKNNFGPFTRPWNRNERV